MEDVFLSYKREDQDRARDVADCLRAEGITVFFDPQICVGDYWDDALERKINDSKAVAPLWSERSCKSPFVRSEAWRGYNRSKLTPARLDGCEIPMFFDNLQTADLRNWARGDLHHYEWRRLVDSIQKLKGNTGPITTTEQTASTAKLAKAQQLPLGGIIQVPLGGSAYEEFRLSAAALAAESAADLASYRYIAGRGEPWAQYMMGVMHLFGHGASLDIAEALQWFRAAAAQGWSGAHYAIGVVNECGVGLKRDVRKAISHYKKAARRGHEAAARNLFRLESASDNAA